MQQQQSAILPLRFAGVPCAPYSQRDRTNSLLPPPRKAPTRPPFAHHTSALRHRWMLCAHQKLTRYIMEEAARACANTPLFHRFPKQVNEYERSRHSVSERDDSGLPLRQIVAAGLLSNAALAHKGAIQFLLRIQAG